MFEEEVSRQPEVERLGDAVATEPVGRGHWLAGENERLGVRGDAGVLGACLAEAQPGVPLAVGVVEYELGVVAAAYGERLREGVDEAGVVAPVQHLVACRAVGERLVGVAHVDAQRRGAVGYPQLVVAVELVAALEVELPHGEVAGHLVARLVDVAPVEHRGVVGVGEDFLPCAECVVVPHKAVVHLPGAVECQLVRGASRRVNPRLDAEHRRVAIRGQPDNDVGLEVGIDALVAKLSVVGVDRAGVCHVQSASPCGIRYRDAVRGAVPRPRDVVAGDAQGGDVLPVAVRHYVAEASAVAVLQVGAGGVVAPVP